MFWSRHALPSVQIVRDGDDVPSDSYCAAVVLRSTYDRDTADLSAREKDILKVSMRGCSGGGGAGLSLRTVFFKNFRTAHQLINFLP